MLEANPTLGWRDVRFILAQTARRKDPADPGWADFGTAPPYHFNHRYGFGVVDAAAARTWKNVGPQISAVTAESRPSLPIPDNDPIGASDTITASGTGIRRIEFIEVTFTAQDHRYSGDLEIVLISPTGAQRVHWPKRIPAPTTPARCILTGSLAAPGIWERGWKGRGG